MSWRGARDNSARVLGCNWVQLPLNQNVLNGPFTFFKATKRHLVRGCIYLMSTSLIIVTRNNRGLDRLLKRQDAWAWSNNVNFRLFLCSLSRPKDWTLMKSFRSQRSKVLNNWWAWHKQITESISFGSISINKTVFVDLFVHSFIYCIEWSHNVLIVKYSYRNSYTFYAFDSLKQLIIRMVRSADYCMKA